jgi:hypothetical protein
MSKVNVTKSEPIRKPSFIPTPSPFATLYTENKTNIKVKTFTRINRTDIQKNPEPTPKSNAIQSDRQATNYIEIIIVYIIYRYCKKPPVKKNPRHNEGLPIHTPPSSPQNRNNQEVYYGFQMQPSNVYRRSNSSNSLT